MRPKYMNRQRPPLSHRRIDGPRPPAQLKMCSPPPALRMPPPPPPSSLRMPPPPPQPLAPFNMPRINCVQRPHPLMDSDIHKDMSSFDYPPGPRMNNNYRNCQIPLFGDKRWGRGRVSTRGRFPTCDQQRMCVPPPPSFTAPPPPPPPLLNHSHHHDHQNSCATAPPAVDMSVPPPSLLEHSPHHEHQNSRAAAPPVNMSVPPPSLLNSGFQENIPSSACPSGPRMKSNPMHHGMPPFHNPGPGMPPWLQGSGDPCRFRGPRPPWEGRGSPNEQVNPYNGQNHQPNAHQRFNRPGHNQKFDRPQLKKKPARKNRQRKTDKRDKPENNAFFCDICDRGFAMEETFKLHCDGHVQCDVDGCTYTAAAKLVKMHQECQHKTGLAKEIWKLESPEAIEKWRMSRKKNYPTAENIAKKETNWQNRERQGNVLRTKRFGKMQRHRGGGRSRCAPVDAVKGFLTDSRVSDSASKPAPAVDAVIHKRIEVTRSAEINIEAAKPESQHKDPDVQPIIASDEHVASSLASSLDVPDALSRALETEEHSSEISQGNAVAAEKPELVVNMSPLTGSLGTLMTSYGNSDDNDDSDEEPAEIFTVKENNITSQNSCSAVTTHTLVNQQLTSAGSNLVTLPPLSRPGDGSHDSVSHDILSHDGACQEKNLTHGSSESQCNKDRSGSERGKKRPYDRHRRQNGQAKRRRNGSRLFTGRDTLLEKLLAPDIRHERNVILQCVRYIVQQNFFDKKT